MGDDFVAALVIFACGREVRERHRNRVKGCNSDP